MMSGRKVEDIFVPSFDCTIFAMSPTCPPHGTWKGRQFRFKFRLQSRTLGCVAGKEGFVPSFIFHHTFQHPFTNSTPTNQVKRGRHWLMAFALLKKVGHRETHIRRLEISKILVRIIMQYLLVQPASTPSTADTRPCTRCYIQFYILVLISTLEVILFGNYIWFK